jgi:hypothetical protein
MRISRLSALAVMATLALAPVANAMPQDQHGPSTGGTVFQQQDLAHLRAGNPLTRVNAPKDRAALAQEKYYSSYGKARPLHRTVATTDDSSPWTAAALGFALIVVVACAVAVAVRTRRRSVRLAV